MKQKKLFSLTKFNSLGKKNLEDEVREYTKSHLKKQKIKKAKKIKEEKILEDNFVYEPKIENYTIIYAARNNLIKLTKDLIKKGANLNIRDKSGFSPLYVAIKNNHKKIIFLLFKYGAGFSIDKNGNTYLHEAAEKNDLKMAKTLIELKFQNRNYDIHKKNFSEETPLDIALKKNHIYLVKYLLEKGSVINLDKLDIGKRIYDGDFEIINLIEGILNTKLFCKFGWSSNEYYLWKKRFGSFGYWEALQIY